MWYDRLDYIADYMLLADFSCSLQGEFLFSRLPGLPGGRSEVLIPLEVGAVVVEDVLLQLQLLLKPQLDLGLLDLLDLGWVRFPVPARPTFIVEKWLFSVTLRKGAHSRALQLRL
jgi:hypothetical protein